MNKSHKLRFVTFMILITAASYFYSSLQPPLSISKQESSQTKTETWIVAQNKGHLPLHIKALYINRNEVPAEAAFLSDNAFRTVKKLRLRHGEEKKIRILHSLTIQRVTIVYEYGGIPYTRTYQTH